MTVDVFLGSGGTLHRALMFMLKLGWKSRFRLPVLIVVVFVAMDIRMHLEFDMEIGDAGHHDEMVDKVIDSEIYNSLCT